MWKKILSSIILILILLSSTFVYATDENTDNTELPSSYDLRNDIRINVENQGQRYWCNAYAITKTIQTYLQKTKGINYNLSEAYLAYSEAPYFGGNVEWKTDIEAARALVEGNVDKYVLESEIPNQDYAFNEINKKKFENAKTVIKSIEFDALEGKEEIKNYIINNGGVWIGIDGATKWYNSSTKAIYCNEKSKKEQQELKTKEQVLKYVEETTAHAVTIIGWDDNYSKNNFNSNCRPENDGAWLIVNSWGANWGNNGTAWVSYEDEATKTYQQIIGMGIKNAKIVGDPPVVDFSYSQRNGYVQAVIKSDEELKDIEGWETTEDKKTFIKTFNEEITPYTLNVYSKLDNSTVAVEVNIPNADFKVYNTNSTIHIEGKNKLDSKDLIFITIALIPIFIILLFILKHFKKKRKD